MHGFCGNSKNSGTTNGDHKSKYWNTNSCKWNQENKILLNFQQDKQHLVTSKGLNYNCIKWIICLDYCISSKEASHIICLDYSISSNNCRDINVMWALSRNKCIKVHRGQTKHHKQVDLVHLWLLSKLVSSIQKKRNSWFLPGSRNLSRGCHQHTPLDTPIFQIQTTKAFITNLSKTISYH